MKKCPNCGSEEFFVTAHVSQDWLVNKNGDFMQVENECVEVTHRPNDEDWWECVDCGYRAVGYKLEVEEKEEKEMQKYTIANYEEFCKNALICPPFGEDEPDDWEEWYDEHTIHITCGNHDIELDYNADNVNEIEYALREMYEVEMDIRGATTSNTVGSEYRDATWKDILRFAVLSDMYEETISVKKAVSNCIHNFSRANFEKIMKRISEDSSTSFYMDEFEVNFFKLNTGDLHKIFDKEERRKAFKKILCSDIRIEELYDKEGRCADKVVITDYSINPAGDMVGWHYGVDWDKDSEDNQLYIQSYIEEMIK